MSEIAISKEEKTWAMFGHLSSFLGWIGLPFANIIAPLIIWQIKKDTMPFAAREAKECLNFQISMTVYAIICFVLVFILVGFFMLAALYVVNIIFTIIAAIKSNDGISYRYPLTIRLVK